MACSWALLTTESGFKTKTTTPVLNTDYLILELLGDDPVTVVETPNTEILRSWLSCNDPDRPIGETKTFAGSIRTLLYPEQAPLLLKWATGRVASQGTPGSEFPWVTSEPADQLASMSLDFAYEDDTGTVRKETYSGGKVDRATLTADRNTRDGAFELTLECTFGARATSSESEPAAGSYITSAPYFLSHSSTGTGLTVNGTKITNYDSLSLNVENTNVPRLDESTTISRIRTRGRNITGQASGLLKFSPDWRALYLARTRFAASLLLTHSNASNTITFDCEAAALGTEWGRSLPLGGDRMQNFTWHSMYDRTAATDFSVTYV